MNYQMSRIVPLYFSHSRNIMNRLTTITIRQNNYQRLKNLGKTGDTFNDVLGRLLDQVEEKDSR